MFTQIEGKKGQKQLVAGFEVSKILAHNGIDMEKPAVLSISYGQIAEEIGNTLADQGLPPDRLSDENVLTLVQQIKENLGSEGILSWQSVVRDLTASNLEVLDLVSVDGNEIFTDAMDGDESSALASAGFGMDEDYGCFGDFEG